MTKYEEPDHLLPDHFKKGINIIFKFFSLKEILFSGTVLNAIF